MTNDNLPFEFGFRSGLLIYWGRLKTFALVVFISVLVCSIPYSVVMYRHQQDLVDLIQKISLTLLVIFFVVRSAVPGTGERTLRRIQTKGRNEMLASKPPVIKHS
jgi:hypothetical protein